MRTCVLFRDEKSTATVIPFGILIMNRKFSLDYSLLNTGVRYYVLIKLHHSKIVVRMSNKFYKIHLISRLIHQIRKFRTKIVICGIHNI